MTEKDQIKILDETGSEKIYNIVLSFDNLETGKSYIIYTNEKERDDGRLEVYASTYNPEEANPKFNKIETKKEWEIVNVVIDVIKEKLMQELEDKND